MNKEKLIYEIDNVTINSLIDELNKKFETTKDESLKKKIHKKIVAYQEFKMGEDILSAAAHQFGFDSLEAFAGMGKITSKDYNNSIESAINNEINSIMNKAKKFENTISKDMKCLENDNSFLFGLDNRFKSYKRIEEKIINKAIEIESTNNISIGSIKEASEDVCDSLRYTLIIDLDNYSRIVKESLNKLESLNYEIVRIKNTWNNDSRYKGINCNLKKVINNESIIFELQFHTPESYKIKGHMTHDVYEIMANDNINSLYTKLANDIQTKISNVIEIPSNVDYLTYDNFKK